MEVRDGNIRFWVAPRRVKSGRAVCVVFVDEYLQGGDHSYISFPSFLPFFSCHLGMSMSPPGLVREIDKTRISRWIHSLGVWIRGYVWCKNGAMRMGMRTGMVMVIE